MRGGQRPACRWCRFPALRSLSTPHLTTRSYAPGILASTRGARATATTAWPRFGGKTRCTWVRAAWVVLGGGEPGGGRGDRWGSGWRTQLGPALLPSPTHTAPHPAAAAAGAVKQRAIHFNQLGLKDNVAQLLLLRRHKAGEQPVGGHGGSARLQQQQQPARHLRFASDDDDEEEGGEGQQGQGAGTAEAAAPMGVDGAEPPCSSSSSGSEVASPPHDHLLVGNIHVLFNPKRGDIKLAQVGRRGWG